MYEKHKVAIRDLLRYFSGRQAFRKDDCDALEREIIDRFAEKEVRVTVEWQQVMDLGPIPWDAKIPGIVLEGSLTPGEFDHERESWEVQHDVLGVDETPGSLQLDGTIKSPKQVTGFTKKP